MSKTIREAYGVALAKLGKENKNIVVLDADVSGSTKSCIFGGEFPERFYNVGIAESNMVAMAAGFSTVGLIPFVNTFAVFLTTNGLIATREMISYSNLNVKLIGAYGGLSDSFDGPTHQAIEDLAIMRTLPNMQVLCPCDEQQTAWMVEYATQVDGPVYIRMSRDAMPDVYVKGHKFKPGVGSVIRQGNDATIIACGIMVGNAMEAAIDLSKEGIEVRVVDMFSIKPLDTQLVIQCAIETGAIITAEEHSIIGGLGSAVAETLAEQNIDVQFARVGMKDCYAECGPYKDLLKKYELDAQAIIKEVKRTIKK